MDADTEALARGWLALRRLTAHADAQGIPTLTAGACRPCMNFVAAMLRGADPGRVRELRCDQAQQWDLEIWAADLVVAKLERQNPCLNR